MKTTKRGRAAQRRSVAPGMVKRTVSMTKEMHDRLELESKKASGSDNFSWEVRECIGRRFDIPPARRHGG